MSDPKILIIDDEMEISELITLYLVKEGYQVITADDGLKALKLLETAHPDLVILDIMLPGLDGFEACREIRRISDVPIIILSGRREETDKILGLGVGADDYITKPFSPGELVARVKAHLRRNRMLNNEKKEQVLKFPDMEIDLASCTVHVNGNPVTLSAKEFQLLTLLAKKPNRVFSTEELFRLVWDSDSLGDLRTVTVHISNLRKKIEQNPMNPKYILTVRGLGYKFNVVD